MSRLLTFLRGGGGHLLLAAVGLVLGAVNLHRGINEWGGDNTTFLCLAEGIIQGQGYSDVYMPEDPGHLRYPPGFPVVLALLKVLLPGLYWQKAALYAIALLGLHLTLSLLRRWVEPLVALGAVLATLVSGVYLDPALSVLSDGLYTVVATAALLVSERALRDPEAGPRSALLTGVLVGLATLVRTVGMVLGPGLVLLALLPGPGSLVGRLRQITLVGLVALGLAAPWLVHSMWTERSSPYLNQLATVTAPESAPAPASEPPAAEPEPEPEPEAEAAEGERSETTPAPDPAEGGRKGPRGAAPAAGGGRAVPPPMEHRGISGGGSSFLARPLLNIEDLVLRAYHLRLPAGLAGLPEAQQHLLRLGFAGALIALGLVALLGCLRGLVVRRSAFDCTTAVYLAALSFWVGGGPRLLMPVLPFLLVWIADGLRLVRCGVVRALGRTRPTEGVLLRQDLAVLGLILLLQAGVTWFSPGMRNRLRGSAEGWWGETFLALGALEELKEPGDLIFARPASLPYVVARLETAKLSRELRSPGEVMAGLEDSGVRWIIESPFLFHDYRKRVHRAIRTYPDRFELHFRKGKVSLYELRPPAVD